MSLFDNENRERIGGRPVVASISGGKDSAAMSLHLRELGIDHKRIFMDTGWEHPATLDYLRGELTKMLGPIYEIRGILGFADLCRKKGMFPSRRRRFCTQQLKVFPMQNYLRGLNDEAVNAIGIRAAESWARGLLPEWEYGDGLDNETWRPILQWSMQDVVDIHKRHNLKPNPLYLKGHSRVGCWPCIFVAKAELKLIAEQDHARIDEIRELETEVGNAAEARQQAKGTTLEEQGYQRPKFFQAMGALRSEGRDGRCVSIDEAVAWAKTGKGGRQFELFATQEPPGCMRWGLCESNWEGD
jgi:3'-phosphoadenosine 5'-phosphosulfate sulfotransferase (PAPS reductase)/FAD synthetase